MADTEALLIERADKFDQCLEEMGATEAAGIRRLVNWLCEQSAKQAGEKSMKALLFTLLMDIPVTTPERATTFWQLRYEYRQERGL